MTAEINVTVEEEATGDDSNKDNSNTGDSDEDKDESDDNKDDNTSNGGSSNGSTSNKGNSTITKLPNTGNGVNRAIYLTVGVSLVFAGICFKSKKIS